MTRKKMTIYSGRIFHFIADPEQSGQIRTYEYLENGALVVSNGHIVEVGTYTEVKKKYEQADCVDYKDKIIFPGFIDTHNHFPQTQIMASYGEKLLTWLEEYTFVAESQYKDPNFVQQRADFFINEMINNGTTTACSFATSSLVSIELLFEAAKKINMRLIAGKVLMDRNVPENIRDQVDTKQLYDENKRLIEKWHKNDRLLYAVTPRFAISSTPEQLDMVGQLLIDFPDVYLQTHLNENMDEIKYVSKLFPKCKYGLNVFEKVKALSKRSVFAHAIHMCDEEWHLLSHHGCTVSHCPSSNLFLGSGLFNLKKCLENKVHFTLGSDIGAGTSFGLLQTMQDAYKISSLNSFPLDPIRSFYSATLGAAKALQMDQFLGNFKTGKEADFIVIDPSVTSIQKHRLSVAKSIEDVLFTLMILGDDRNIYHTYIAGVQRKRS